MAVHIPDLHRQRSRNVEKMLRKKNSEFQYSCIKSDCTDSSKAASGVGVKPQGTYRKVISEGSACTRLTDALGIAGI